MGPAREKFMIKHIVMWTLAESEDKQENLIRMKLLLDGLVGRIEQIVTLEVAINPVAAPDPVDIVLYSEFRSQADLDAYACHPEHLEVGRFIQSVCQTRSAVDYKI